MSRIGPTPKRIEQFAARIESLKALSPSLETATLEGVHGKVILNRSYMAAGKILQQKSGPHTLADLPIGARCVLDHLDVPADVARRLMELGFLPGNEIVPARKAPGGGPRVYRVDGSEVALRKETAAKLHIRRHPDSDLVVLR